MEWVRVKGKGPPVQSHPWFRHSPIHRSGSTPRHGKTVQALETSLSQGVENTFAHHQDSCQTQIEMSFRLREERRPCLCLDLLTKHIQSQQWCILCGVSEVNGASSPRFRPVASTYTSTVKVIALAAEEQHYSGE